MTHIDVLTANQLLGRLVYFHTLFIEPKLPGRLVRSQVTLCCRHDRRPNSIIRSSDNTPRTPWEVLIEIAGGLGPAQCTPSTGECCVPCRVRSCATVIAETWLTVESDSYSGCLTSADHQAWAASIGGAIAKACAEVDGADCARTEDYIGTVTPPADRFPLSSELAALWSATDAGSPVISWLNHCAGLDDIARRIRLRSAA